MSQLTISHNKSMQLERRRKRRLDLPLDLIKARYEAGENSPALAKEYKVTPAWLIKRLRDVGTKIRPQGTIYFWTPEMLEKAEQLKALGYSGRKVAECLGVTADAVYKQMDFPKIRTELPKEEIIEKYNKGASTISLGRQYNVTKHTICRRLREWGVTIRPTGRAPKLDVAVVGPLKELLATLERFRNTDRGWQQRHTLDPQIMALKHVIKEPVDECE